MARSHGNGKRALSEDHIRPSVEETTYGDCPGCDTFGFLRGGTCLNCRTISEGLADDRPNPKCSCDKNRQARVVNIDSSCPLHGLDF